MENLENLECLIIDNFDNNINEEIFYSLLNQSKQLDNYILINSQVSIKDFSFRLEANHPLGALFLNIENYLL